MHECVWKLSPCTHKKILFSHMHAHKSWKPTDNGVVSRPQTAPPQSGCVQLYIFICTQNLYRYVQCMCTMCVVYMLYYNVWGDLGTHVTSCDYGRVESHTKWSFIYLHSCKYIHLLYHGSLVSPALSLPLSRFIVSGPYHKIFKG